jgi:hypothetical protein
MNKIDLIIEKIETAKTERLERQRYKLIDEALAAARELHGVNQELVEALEVLSGEANRFNVSGVYFNEEWMGHRGLDLAQAALAKAKGEV